MLPGGITAAFATDRTPTVAYLLAVLAIRKVWPEAECERAGKGDHFVYKNRRTMIEWDRLGADPVCLGTMVQVTVTPGVVELVLDELSGDGARICDEVGKALAGGH